MALVIAMLVMAVLLLAGTSFLTISSTESQIAVYEKASVQAFLLAEAAIHKASAQLSASASYPGESNTTLGGGTFTVNVSAAPTAEQHCPGSTAKTVVARAQFPVRGGQADVELRAIVDRVSYPYRYGAYSAIANGIVASQTDLTAPPFSAVTVDRTNSEVWFARGSAGIVSTDSFDSTIGPYNPTTDPLAGSPPNPLLAATGCPAGASTVVAGGTGGNIGANGDVRMGDATCIKGSIRAGDAIYTGASVTTGPSASSLSANEPFPDAPFPGVSFPWLPGVPLPAKVADPNVPLNGTLTLTGNVNYGSLTFVGGAASSQATLSVPASGVTINVENQLRIGNRVTLTVSGGPVTINAMGPVEIAGEFTLATNGYPLTLNVDDAWTMATGPLSVLASPGGPVTINVPNGLTLDSGRSFSLTTASGGTVTLNVGNPTSNPALTLNSGATLSLLTVEGGPLTVNVAGTAVLAFGCWSTGCSANVLTSGNSAASPVTLNVEDHLGTGNNVTMGAYPGTNLRILLGSGGGTTYFYAGNNFRLHGSLYAKNTNVYLGYDSEVFGSVVGRTLLFYDRTKIHFDQAMLNQELCHSGKYAVRRGTWREVIP